MSAPWGDAKSWETADDRCNSDLDRDGYVVLPAAVPTDAVHAALRLIGLGIRRHGLPGGAEHADCQGGTFLPELRDDPAIWGLCPTQALGDQPPWHPEESWAEPQILLRFPDEAPEPDHEFGSEFCLDFCGLSADALMHAARPALVPHVDEEPPWAGHEFAPVWRGSPLPDNPCGHPEPSDGFYAGPSRCGKFAEHPIHVRRRYRAIVGVALTDHGPDDGALHVWPRTHRLGYVPKLRENSPVPVPLKAGDAVVLDPKLAHAGSLNLGHTVRTMVYFRLLGGS